MPEDAENRSPHECAFETVNFSTGLAGFRLEAVITALIKD
jgi:hypothetical protein